MFLDAGKVARTYNICVLHVHAFMGCDTISAFAHKPSVS